MHPLTSLIHRVVLILIALESVVVSVVLVSCWELCLFPSSTAYKLTPFSVLEFCPCRPFFVSADGNLNTQGFCLPSGTCEFLSSFSQYPTKCQPGSVDCLSTETCDFKDPTCPDGEECTFLNVEACIEVPPSGGICV